MAEALAFFEKQLSTLCVDSPEPLRQAFEMACRRFEFMCATLETENAYNIFKSLNSMGVPLGPADLIRNFVFMHVQPDEQDDFDRTLWGPLEANFTRTDGTLDEAGFSGFFRDYLMSSGPYVPPKDTFASFESRYEATGFSPVELTRALTESCRHYRVISGKTQDESDHVTKALSGLNLLESSTTYPLLLALFEKRARGEIDNPRLAEAIEMLRGFILRRFVCGQSSRGYGEMFVRGIPNDCDDSVKALESYLLHRGWPDDRQFEAAFVRFPLYRRGYTREVLGTLERARGHKEPADLTTAQIEHVLPRTLSDAWVEALGPEAQRIQADWLDCPGNLTLTGYNTPLGNHAFEIKRREYAQSNIVLTRDLATYDRWTDVEIEGRGRQLAREAVRIWIGPKEGVARPERGFSGELTEKGQLYLRYWTEFRAFMADKSPIKCHKAYPQDSMTHSLGRSGVYLASIAVFSNWDDAPEPENRVELGLEGDEAKHWFERLEAEKTEIDREFGASLLWYNPADANRCTIALRRPANIHDEKLWPEQFEWLRHNLELLAKVFGPRVKAL